MYLNIHTLTGYAFFIVTTFLTYLLLMHIELKYITLIMSINSASVVIVSIVLFGEKLNHIGFLGFALVILGMNIFII